MSTDGIITLVICAVIACAVAYNVGEARGKRTKESSSSVAKLHPTYDSETMILIEGPMIKAKRRCILHYGGYAFDNTDNNLSTGWPARGALGRKFLSTRRYAIRSSLEVLAVHNKTLEIAHWEIAGEVSHFKDGTPVDYEAAKPEPGAKTTFVYPCVVNDGRQRYYSTPKRFVVDTHLRKANKG
jgi:hypothetical protein